MKLRHALPLVMLGWFAGCRHVPQPAPTGGSSFVFIEPPPAPTTATSDEIKEPISRSVYIEARTIQPLTLPVHPAKALMAKAGAATVGMNVTVDATGRVTDIRPSILTFTTPGPFSEDFRAAVETVLQQWRFVPAETQDLEPIPGLEMASNRIVRSERVETTFEQSFTFTAKGEVQLTPKGR